MVRAGGTSDVKPIDDGARHAINAVKGEVQNRTGKNLETYDPVSYKSQVVAGTNYFAKVHVGNDDYLHLRIYKDLSNNIQLSDLQQGKTKDDEIEYF
jgi:cystatin-A/B